MEQQQHLVAAPEPPTLHDLIEFYADDNFVSGAKVRIPHRATRDALLNLATLLREAKCPNANCDGEGHIAWDTGESIEWEQCRWCWEQGAALASLPTPQVSEVRHD